jgi:hypothetical protein
MYSYRTDGKHQEMKLEHCKGKILIDQKYRVPRSLEVYEDTMVTKMLLSVFCESFHFLSTSFL